MKSKFDRKTLFLALIIAVIMTGSVFARPVLRTIEVSDYDVAVQLNGKEMQFGDEKPFIYNGTTYVPIKDFAEQDNKKVSWDSKNKKVIIEDGSKISVDPRLEQNVSGTLWLMSGENRANSYQTFNLAKMMFHKAVEENKGKEKLAVIVDIDDAIIDSTSYTCQLMGGKEWTTQAWEEWVASNSPKAIPGAVEFLNYVKEQGGEVFYITNRWPGIREATLESLNKLGFPIEDEKNLFVREDGTPSSKESRRNIVEKDYNVVLLIGDNLEDFSDEFSPSLGLKGRAEAVDEFKEDWGTKFIVLPNPMYGDWEKAIIDNKKGLSIEETIEMRRKVLLQNQ